LSLRFLLDEDLSGRIAEGLRLLGVDAVSVHELGRTGLTDEAQLLFASSEDRVVVTYNRADFMALDAGWRLAGRTHSGILWGSERSMHRRDIEGLVQALAFTAFQYESLLGLCLPISRPPFETL
jgi:hypothetical protein